jgi:hypothetical protein
MASSAIDLHLISSGRALASATKLEADASFRKFLPEGNLEDTELPVPEACLCRRPQTYSLDQGQKHISEHSLHHHQSGRSAQKSVYQLWQRKCRYGSDGNTLFLRVPMWTALDHTI